MNNKKRSPRYHTIRTNMSICKDSASFLSSLLEVRNPSEQYADLQSRAAFFGLSMPPVLPGSLLPPPDRSHTAPAKVCPHSVTTFQNFVHSANSLRMNHAPDREYCAILVSPAKCRDEKERTHETGPHSPEPVDFFFDRAVELTESSADGHPRHTADGAVKRCEASVKRLERINEMLESFAEGAWSSGDDMQTLARDLRRNKHYSAIQSRMLHSRLMRHERQPMLADVDIFAADPNLFNYARSCGAEMNEELISLQMLEEQTLKTVQAMVASMSGDVPICTEEARSIVSSVRAKFGPAHRALSAAMRRLAVEKDSHSSIAR